MGCGGSKPQASTVVAVTTKDPDAPAEVTKKEVSTKTKVRTIRYEDKVKRIVETTITYDDGTTSTSSTEQEYTIEDAERLFGVGPGGNASKTAAADITPEEAMAVSQAVLTEMTRIRAEPELYVAKLQELKSRMQGNVVFLPNRPPFTLKEGPAAIDEAISFLQQQKPLVELTWSAGLTRACMDHVKDVGPKGALTHEGSDGCDFEDRLKRYGDYNGRVAENLAFSRFTAEDMVLYWLLSDGEPTRQQRKTLFDPIFTTAGVYYGTHASATAMCCALLAFSYHENKEGQKAIEGMPTAPVAPPASS